MPPDIHPAFGDFYDLMYVDVKSQLPAIVRTTLAHADNVIKFSSTDPKKAVESLAYFLELDFQALSFALQKAQALMSECALSHAQARVLLENTAHLDIHHKLQLLDAIYPLLKYPSPTARLLQNYTHEVNKNNVDNVGSCIYQFLNQVAVTVPHHLLKTLAEYHKDAVFQYIQSLDRESKLKAYVAILEQPSSALYQLFHQQRGIRKVSESRGLLGEIRKDYDYLTSWRSRLDDLMVYLRQRPVENSQQTQAIDPLLQNLDAQISYLLKVMRETTRRGSVTSVIDFQARLFALEQARLCYAGNMTREQLAKILAKNAYYVAATQIHQAQSYHAKSDAVTGVLVEILRAQPVVGVEYVKATESEVVGVPVGTVVKNFQEQPVVGVLVEESDSATKVSKSAVQQATIPSTVVTVRRLPPQSLFGRTQQLSEAARLQTLLNGVSVPSHPIEAPQQESVSAPRPKQFA